MKCWRSFLRTAWGRQRERAPAGPAQLRLRPMKHRDVEAVHGIEVVAFPGPWRASSFARAVDHPAQHFVVAELGRELVGYGGFWVEGDRAHLAKVAVHPAHRRRGIATALVTHLLNEIRRQGLRETYLEVRKSNTGAQELYRRMGFRFQRTVPRAYPSDGEDALVFVLAEPPTDDSDTEG